MAPSPSHSQSLLPNPGILILDRIERDVDRFRLMARVDQEPTCPVCGVVSRSGHSSYRRCLQDLPWQGVTVQLCVRIGRFRCRNSSCPRKIFCERLPQVTRVYGRQTERASEIVRLIGYVAGGRPGQRLLARLSIATSDDTILRRVREQAPLPRSSPPIYNLGVDDWAWRKGQEYGTILVDLELHRVVDLLADRAAESFSEWLQQHPEIVTISRDRSGLYAEGATLGAPQAQQVADRFHLVLNLSATMERVLEERSRQLILPPVEVPLPPSQSANTGDVSPDVPAVAPSHPTPSQLRRERRLERYQQVIALFNSGHSQAEIARTLGMERKTVRRWLRRGQFPERKPPHRRPPKVNEFADYLQQRWDEGCHNASRLYQEIREKGYSFPRWFIEVVAVPGNETRRSTRARQSPSSPYIHVRVDMRLQEMQVEGQVNRLKTIKRQMYGRAGFELLRARVLPNPGMLWTFLEQKLQRVLTLQRLRCLSPVFPKRTFN